MKLVADRVMVDAAEAFGDFGELSLVDGRSLAPSDLAECDVLLVRSVTRVNQALLADTPVRFVGTATAGTDHIDLDYLAGRGTAFAAAPGCNARAVGEYVLACVLALHPAQALDGLRCGIIGLGHAGSAAARLLAAAGVSCIACDPPRAAVEGEQGFVTLAAALDEDHVDASLEAACAKVFASELVWRTADELVQLAGGRGFVKPWPYERYLRDARINRIFEGANEVLRLFIALNGIQGPAEELKELAGALKNPIQNWVLVSSYAADRVASALGRKDRFDVTIHPSLRRHAEFVEKHVAALAAATQKMVMTHKQAILHRQLVVERLADMAIELYARTTTIARTQRLIDEHGAEACAREIALTDLFCIQSGRRFRAIRMELDGDAGEAIDDLRRDIAARIRAEHGYGSSDALMDVAVTRRSSADPA